MSMTTPITKEWLQKAISEMEAARDDIPFGFDEDGSNTLSALKMALTSLSAEPVGEVSEQPDGLVMDGMVHLGGSRTHRVVKGLNKMKRLPLGTKFYTAPPAPVSVPDGVTAEDCPAFVKYDVTDVDEAWARGYNACRAAMLQGAEHVTTAYKLSFEQWLSQQTGTIDVECGCVMTEVFFHWLRVAYEAGNSPAIPDGWAMMPKEPAPGMINAWLSEVANFRGHAAGYRAALAAAPDFREIVNSSTNNFRENAETSTKCWCHTCRPVTISDMRFVVCPECGNKRCPKANDHRHSCTGSNEPGQEGSAYPAAPQQEGI